MRGILFSLLMVSMQVVLFSQTTQLEIKVESLVSNTSVGNGIQRHRWRVRTSFDDQELGNCFRFDKDKANKNTAYLSPNRYIFQGTVSDSWPVINLEVIGFMDANNNKSCYYKSEDTRGQKQLYKLKPADYLKMGPNQWHRMVFYAHQNPDQSHFTYYISFKYSLPTTVNTIKTELPPQVYYCQDEVTGLQVEERNPLIATLIENGIPIKYQWDRAIGFIEKEICTTDYSRCETLGNFPGCEITTCESIETPNWQYYSTTTPTSKDSQLKDELSLSKPPLGNSSYRVRWKYANLVGQPNAKSVKIDVVPPPPEISGYATNFSGVINDRRPNWDTLEDLEYRPSGKGMSIKNVSVSGGADGQLMIHDLSNGTTNAVRASLKNLDNGIPVGNAVGDGPPIIIESLSSGLYELQLEFTNTGSCFHTYRLRIHEPDPIAVVTSRVDPTSCFSMAALDGSLSVNGTGGVGHLTYKSGDIDQPEGIFEGIAPGSYTLKLIDEAGHFLVFPFTIHEPDPIEGQVDLIHNSCQGLSKGEATFRIMGGTAPYRAALLNELGSQLQNVEDIESELLFTDLAAGFYSVRVTDANYSGLPGECEWTNTFQVLQPEAIRMDDFVPTPPTCIGGNDGEISFTIFGGTPGASGYSVRINSSLASEKVGDQFTFDGLSSGENEVQVRDENNCVEIFQVNVPDTSHPLALLFTDAQPPTCYAGIDGHLRLMAVGGPALSDDISYELVNTGQQQNLFNTDTAHFINLEAGFYQLKVSRGICTFTQWVEIPDAVPIGASLTDSRPVSCQGAKDGTFSMQLNGGKAPYRVVANGTESHEWKDLNAGLHVLGGLRSGSYTIEVFDENGCQLNADTDLIRFQLMMIEPPPLQINVEVIHQVSCANGQDGWIQLSASGGHGQYQFQLNGAGYQASSIFENLGIGTYAASVKDRYGCVNTMDFTITAPEPLTFDPLQAPLISCNGASDGRLAGIINGGTPPYSYALAGSEQNNTSGTVNIEDLKPGAYELIITDQLRCEYIHNFSITEPDKLNARLTDVSSATCGEANGGAVLTADGGTPPYTFDWYKSGIYQFSGNLKNDLPAGLYQVVVKDALNCQKNVSVGIGNETGPQLETVDLVYPSCSDRSDGRIEFLISEGIPPFDISWSTGTSGNYIDHLSRGEYVLSVTDGNGCITTKTYQIDLPRPIGVNEIANDPTCTGLSNGSIELQVSGGQPPYTIQWSDHGEGMIREQLAANNYAVIIQDANGCQWAGSYTLSDPDPVPLTIPNRQLCEGQHYHLNFDLPGIYKWTADNGFYSQESEVFLDKGGSYQLNYTNENGCQASANFDLIISDQVLDAQFLMADEAIVGDTIMVIDISWPPPDFVNWNWPSEGDYSVIYQNGSYAEIVFGDTGLFQIGMVAQLAGCESFFDQEIVVHPVLHPSDSQVFATLENGIKDLAVYPNPTNRMFNVDIELDQASEVTLSLLHLSGSMLQFHYSDKSALHHFVLEAQGPKGQYLLQVHAAGETKSRKLVIE